MGGSAFAAGENPLWTPRMPKAVYENAKSQCHASLRELYYCVASPIDGPGKIDFGDVDILVAWSKGMTTTRDETLDAIASALKATRVIRDKGKDISAHFAFPWPDEVSTSSDSLNEDALQEGSKPQPGQIPDQKEPIFDQLLMPKPALEFDNQRQEMQASQKPNDGQQQHETSLSNGSSFLRENQRPLLFAQSSNDLYGSKQEPYEEEQQCNLPQTASDMMVREPTFNRNRFIQVDVRVCESLDQLQWMLFKHAHGDIWNLLGTTIRPYGLSVDEMALWLRIPEIEYRHRNRAKVFISSDPVEILHFLGLPIEGYWEEPFKDLDSMYEYVALCRLFWVTPPVQENGGTGDNLEQDRKKLKANDRRRMNQRPGFRKWIEEFKPRCREEGRFLEQPTTREAVTEEAFSCWPNIQKEFTTRRDEFLLEQQRDMIWNKVIKGSIPDVDGSDPRAVQYRSCLVKALKRIILEGDDKYGVVPGDDLKDKQGFYIVENVLDFIARNQEAVGKAAFELNMEAYREHLAQKALRGADKEMHQGE